MRISRIIDYIKNLRRKKYSRFYEESKKRGRLLPCQVGINAVICPDPRKERRRQLLCNERMRERGYYAY